MINIYMRWLKAFTAIILLFPLLVTAQSGINEIGSFEQENPSYWNKAGEPGGATLTWATDQFITLGRSLKITKEATGDAAYWESDNMCDIWSPTHSQDVDIKIGAWIRTEGVNTNPQTEDEKWYISYTFMGEAGNLIGEVKLPIDQTVASSNGWVADTNDVGSLILPEPSYTTTIKFVGGKDAVGTVWADEFILNGRTDWAGGIWNETLGVPEGWIYWLPRTDGDISDGYERTRVTDEEAYHGKYSLKYDMLDGTHDGFIGTRMYELNEVEPGDKIRISVWIKGEDLQPDSVLTVGDQWTISLTPIFHNSLGGNGGFNDIWASDIPLFFPAVTQFDWTQYYVDVTVPENALSLSMRLHPLGRFQGTVFMDAMTVEKLDLPEMSEIGSFEQENPAYWNKAGEPGGATLTWAEDQFITLGRSLKITKDVTGDAAYWESDNMCDIWSPTHSQDVDIKIGAWIRTEGVNTNPQTEDEKWYISYTFMGETGNLIGEVKLPIDQTVASSNGWVADTNDVGSLILPEPSYTTTIKFVGGKDATGTVWADEFILNGRTDWAGGIWNETLGVPEGWIYWLPRTDGDISDGYERTRITDEEAYHGKYSLKYDMLDGTHDGFIGTRMFPLNNTTSSSLNKATDITALNDVNVGDWLRISVWIKGENLVPDSVIAVGDQWTVSLTPIFHNSLGGNDGFNDIWASDIPLFFPAVTEFDWTQYYVDVQVPENALSLSMRLHPLGRFQGTVYMDAMTIEKLDLPEMSDIGSFEQTDPAYWNKAGEPGGATLTWAEDQFITLGRSLKITKDVTGDAAYWESDNMCDIWSPTHSQDVDIKIGAWIKTEGVNTNPQTEDEKWYISYTFMGEAGNLIGEVKLPIDQTVASSNGWVADTNDVGSLILPEPSYNTTIKFVGGKDATGTVWADEFILNGRTDWAGGIWNETLGVPKGWIYWLPRTDGDISDGYERTRITDEEAYHGKYSLKYDLLDGTHDGFIGTRMFPLNNTTSDALNKSNDITALNDVNVGDWLRISVWIMGEDLQPDSVLAVGDQWTVSLTPIFHNSLGGNDGFNDIWASDIPLFFPTVTSFGWTQYYVDVQVPENALSLSMRLHPLGRFQGTVYMDAMEIKKINDVTELEDDQFLPTDYNLYQNYPNPFNPTTIISYSLPQTNKVTIRIYDMLGRMIRTLVNEVQNAGMQKVVWNGENNSGNKVSSGTYIYRIDAGDYHMAKKMLLLK